MSVSIQFFYYTCLGVLFKDQEKKLEKNNLNMENWITLGFVKSCKNEEISYF